MPLGMEAGVAVEEVGEVRGVVDETPPRFCTSTAITEAISFCPPLFARASGVMFEALVNRQSAPLRSNTFTMSSDPCKVATCKGVLPALFLLLISRPRRNRGSKAPVKPIVHASCSRLFPFSFTRWKSAPAFINFSNRSKDFRRTVYAKAVQS